MSSNTRVCKRYTSGTTNRAAVDVWLRCRPRQAGNAERRGTNAFDDVPRVVVGPTHQSPFASCSARSSATTTNYGEPTLDLQRPVCRTDDSIPHGCERKGLREFGIHESDGAPDEKEGRPKHQHLVTKRA